MLVYEDYKVIIIVSYIDNVLGLLFGVKCFRLASEECRKSLF